MGQFTFNLPEGDFENPALRQQEYDILKPDTGSVVESYLGKGLLDSPTDFITDLQRTDADLNFDGVPAKLSPEEANAKYGIPGALNFDRPMLPSTAQVIQERTLKQLAFDDIISRATGGQKTLGLAASFAGQMFDPINLASAGIPITRMPGASNFIMSNFGQRLTQGAAGGFVGSVLVEPIYVYGDQTQFEEHTALDTMRNLAFGTIFGAGLNVTIGGVFDGASFLYGKTRTQHETAATAAFNNLIEGRVVAVDPILRADPVAERIFALNELRIAEASGDFSGITSYGKVTGPETDLGLGNLKIFQQGEQIIGPNIPRNYNPVVATPVYGELFDIDLGGSNKAKLLKGEEGNFYVKFAQDTTDVGSISSDHQKNAVRYYTHEGASFLNKKLRDSSVPESHTSVVEAIDYWISQGRAESLPKQVWRMAQDDEVEIYNTLEKGDTFTKKDYTSTYGTKEAFEYSFLGPDETTLEVEIHLPKEPGYGRRVEYDSGDELAHEKEFLIGRETTFKVLNKTPGKIVLEVIPKPKEKTSLENDLDRVKIEVLANRLYQLFDDQFVLPNDLINHSGKTGVATRMVDAEPITQSELIDLYEAGDPEFVEQIDRLVESSVFDMFLANWDALNYGNLLLEKGSNQLLKIDQGGALTYRAQGERKGEAFTDHVGEVVSMMEQNPILGYVMSKNHMERGLEKLFSKSFPEIVNSVRSMGFTKSEEAELLSKLASRMKDLKHRFPKVVEKVASKTGKIESTHHQHAFDLMEKEAIKFNELIMEHPNKSDLISAIRTYQEGSSNLTMFLKGLHKKPGSVVNFSPEFEKYLQSMANDLEKAAELGKLGQEAVLYRWIPENWFDEGANVEPAFMSTSIFAETSPFHIDKEEMRNLLVVIHADAGTAGFYPDAVNVTHTMDGIKVDSSFSGRDYGGEVEFVIGRNAQYEIIAPKINKLSANGNAYKELHIRLVPKLSESQRPYTLSELATLATKYRDLPSAAAEPEILLPIEAVQFNSYIPKDKFTGEVDVDPAILADISDLEAQIKMHLTPDEIKVMNEAFKNDEVETDSYLKGLAQAFICWKNG